jgi:hypothetical protein
MRGLLKRLFVCLIGFAAASGVMWLIDGVHNWPLLGMLLPALRLEDTNLPGRFLA